MSQLVRAVGTIPATTARERLAQSEIAKKVRNRNKLDLVQELNWVNFKVAHLMRAVHSVFEGAPASGKTKTG